MRVNRRLLFWGFLLLAIGGVIVAANLGVIDTAALADLVRLWPLALITIGLAIVLRRSTVALPALLAAALIPGVVMGAAFAVAPRFADACGVRDDLSNVATDQGTFAGPASVTVRSGCGVLDLTTDDREDWSFEGRATINRSPNIRATDRSLAIETTVEGLSFIDTGRHVWDLALPADGVDDLNVTVVAGHGNLDLDGADIDRLAVTANAAKIVADASGATVADLRVVVNAGAVSLRLPTSGDLTGSLTVNAGDLAVCAPPDLGLRVVSNGTAAHISVGSEDLGDGAWTSPNYRSAAHHADLEIRSNFGAVEFNPIGGCE